MFDWEDYLTVAEDLRRSASRVGHTAACQRSAISRAYYAVFCRARNCLRDREGLAVPRDGSAHRFVYEQLDRSGDINRQVLAQYLSQLRVDRNHADYEDLVSGLPRKARRNVQVARQALTLVGSLWP